jgi:hypothetical protein
MYITIGCCSSVGRRLCHVCSCVLLWSPCCCTRPVAQQVLYTQLVSMCYCCSAHTIAIGNTSGQSTANLAHSGTARMRSKQHQWQQSCWQWVLTHSLLGRHYWHDHTTTVHLCATTMARYHTDGGTYKAYPLGPLHVTYLLQALNLQPVAHRKHCRLGPQQLPSGAATLLGVHTAVHCTCVLQHFPRLTNLCCQLHQELRCSPTCPNMPMNRHQHVTSRRHLVRMHSLNQHWETTTAADKDAHAPTGKVASVYNKARLVAEASSAGQPPHSAVRTEVVYVWMESVHPLPQHHRLTCMYNVIPSPPAQPSPPGQTIRILPTELVGPKVQLLSCRVTIPTSKQNKEHVQQSHHSAHAPCCFTATSGLACSYNSAQLPQ